MASFYIAVLLLEITVTLSHVFQLFHFCIAAEKLIIVTLAGTKYNKDFSTKNVLMQVESSQGCGESTQKGNR